jgi:pimeloyl-ACP methyl ester carboxylesterase
MYRDLILDLSDKYHLVAPDYPGFGYSAMPDRTVYPYTFDQLSAVMEKFTDALSLGSFHLYMQDYGAPVGYRIAARRPELIKSLIIQNANAYLEGLGPATEAGQQFWADRNKETETTMRELLTLEGTKAQYLEGAGDRSRLSPDAWHLDQYFLERPGNKDIQLDLLYDYRNNLKCYPEWQAYLRKHQPPALIVWGKNDPLFTEAGARAYLKDLPEAEFHLFDTGHFALEEYHRDIGALMDIFLQKHG